MDGNGVFELLTILANLEAMLLAPLFETIHANSGFFEL
jgi:hypothetical protein